MSWDVDRVEFDHGWEEGNKEMIWSAYVYALVERDNLSEQLEEARLEIELLREKLSRIQEILKSGVR